VRAAKGDGLGTLAAIYRYPVKALAGEALDAVTLAPGDGVPGDRTRAIATGAAPFDPAGPRPWPKTTFLTVMRYPALARFAARHDTGQARLTLADGDEELFSGHLDDEADGARLGAALQAALRLPSDWRPSVVRAPDWRFTDASVEGPRLMRSLSLINLATLAELERVAGRTLDRRRFRANLYIDGVPPWGEFDWLEREISVGPAVRLRVLMRTPRCAAIEADPATGKRDIALTRLLRERYGHVDCGVQVEVTAGGAVETGAAVRLLT
jgi:hypothetical protein